LIGGSYSGVHFPFFPRKADRALDVEIRQPFLMVTDEEFQSAAEEVDIKFLNKEHFFYWRIYNEVVGQIPKARGGEISCPCCGAGMGTYHCPTCGFSHPLKECL
jgi:hypothetical protein